MKLNGWDHSLKVTADGKGIVGHAGAVLLRKACDQLGLTAGLSAALRRKGTSPLLDRGTVLASLAVAMGATSMSETLTGWLVIDMDATLVTASSDKEGAAPTWKMGYGFPPARRLVREHPRVPEHAAAARQRGVSATRGRTS